jgi:hypothetical protein
LLGPVAPVRANIHGSALGRDTPSISVDGAPVDVAASIPVDEVGGMLDGRSRLGSGTVVRVATRRRDVAAVRCHRATNAVW